MNRGSTFLKYVRGWQWFWLLLFVAALGVLLKWSTNDGGNHQHLLMLLGQYEKQFREGEDPPQGETAEAICQYSDIAIPVLLRMVQTRDRFAIQRFLQRWSGGKVHPTDAPEARAHAMGIAGFAALGTNGAPAVEELIQLLESEHGIIRRNAAISLGYLGSAADPAVTHIVRHFKDEDYKVSTAAVWAGGNLRLRAELVVPALIQVIQGSHLSCEPFEALGKFGREAEPAVPTLLRLAKGADPAKVFCARETLKRLHFESGADSGDHDSRPVPLDGVPSRVNR